MVPHNLTRCMYVPLAMSQIILVLKQLSSPSLMYKKGIVLAQLQEKSECDCESHFTYTRISV